MVSTFEEGMELAQQADYALKFSEDEVQETVGGATKLLSKVKELLK